MVKEEIKNSISYLKDNLNFLSDYTLLEIEEGHINQEKRTKNLIEIFKNIEPHYYDNHNKIERTKKKEDQILIDKNYELSPEGNEISDKVLAMYYANKIAHVASTIQKTILNELLTKKNLKIDHAEFNKINSYLKKYFFKFASNDSKNTYAENLAHLGLDSSDLSYLKNIGVDTLVNTWDDAMFIKDLEIHGLIDLLKDNKQYSYGIAKDNKNLDMFVVDLPTYEQVSVHIKDSSLISLLNDKKYKYPVYKKKTAILTDKFSEGQESFNYEYSENLIKSLRNKMLEDPSNPAYHDYAVKLGFTPDELDLLYDDKNANNEQER